MKVWQLSFIYLGGLSGFIFLIYLGRVWVKAISGVFKGVGETYNPDCDEDKEDG